MNAANPPKVYETGESAERFREKVESLSGQKTNLCNQCGACSSSCPMTSYMDLLPSKVMRLTQLGDPTPVKSLTIWVCSTCFSCSARCPRDIDIADVMEAYRQISLRKKESIVRLETLTASQLKDMPPIALISALRKMSP